MKSSGLVFLISMFLLLAISWSASGETKGHSSSNGNIRAKAGGVIIRPSAEGAIVRPFAGGVIIRPTPPPPPPKNPSTKG
jgi:hypothetical protein